ncbi:homocysteine S-methyltransferase family protein [Lutibaculum baratangense]|uniref:Homocysteine S-methyltransferase n=1 Tax=Lutibaculum baratangense AMV1 TaxID=631454 RepID=V4RBY8_9HYPH|nr:homocysteine S-methyltransferase family protein [Lutibaculum baratangense]ESR23681.1 Homocysteine S-methyltransferase [Lutibaculum baratangense AMV1]
MTKALTILDGGMGRQLLAQGAPFALPEWSALALIEAPQHVLAAHEAFVAAGADVITTNSYALVPPCLGEARFRTDAERLADLAARLAAMAREAASRPVRVAGSLPPLFGSYRPDLFRADEATALYAPLVRGLDPHVDLWLGETLSSIAEAEAVAAAVEHDDRPLWLSFTLSDEAESGVASALRSGEPVSEAVTRAAGLGAAAVLFNCSRAEVMAGAVAAASKAFQAEGAAPEIGVYANAFAPEGDMAEDEDVVTGMREDLGPTAYLGFVREWIGCGATIAGGCCGIGPEHIEVMRREFSA